MYMSSDFRFRTWKFYVAGVFFYFLYLLSLTCYTLARFGNVFVGQRERVIIKALTRF